MADVRDDAVARFDRRASTYEEGAVARWHAQVVERSADFALSAMPVPLRVLDVGCGTGALLREVVIRVPYGESFVGIDPSPRMLARARRNSDRRIRFARAAAEALPFPDSSFDLVVTTTSFDHWADQGRGIAELARVVARTGCVVIVDLSASWLPSKGRARSPHTLTGMLADAGLHVERREVVHRLAWSVPLVRGFAAFR